MKITRTVWKIGFLVFALGIYLVFGWRTLLGFIGLAVAMSLIGTVYRKFKLKIPWKAAFWR